MIVVIILISLNFDNFRYSKGFGVVEFLLGKEHFLNLPNCILGIVFYFLQLTLG
jgi:vitamin-K-epoxide reductase (warfarin-sensitive)